MTKPLRTEEEAKAELAEAIRWYEERKPGLGGRLLAAIDRALDRVQRFPQAGATVPYVALELGVRRCPIGPFPFHLIYLETSDAIHILAFAHQRRRPGYWLPRAEGVR